MVKFVTSGTKVIPLPDDGSASSSTSSTGPAVSRSAAKGKQSLPSRTPTAGSTTSPSAKSSTTERDRRALSTASKFGTSSVRSTAFGKRAKALKSVKSVSPTLPTT